MDKYYDHRAIKMATVLRQTIDRYLSYLSYRINDTFFWFDPEKFEMDRAEQDEIYGVCILDTNRSRRQLFKCVDSFGDKIVHIVPKLCWIKAFETYGRIYVYVKSEFAPTLFSDYRIPKDEILHSIKLRDYFTLDRFPETRTIYCKTDYLLNRRFHRWLSNQPDIKNIVLITGSADYTIDDTIVEHFGNRVSYWFGTNVMSSLDHVQGIPLGITSFDPHSTSCKYLFEYGDSSPYHRIFADDSCFMNLWNLPKTHQHKIHMNFNTKTFSDRVRIWEEFKEHPWVCTSSYGDTLDARKNYFKELRNAEYNLCPRGNGIDTHRFWESLYTGVIPIVERSRVYEFFEDSLPFVQWDKLSTTECSEETLRLNIDVSNINYHKLYTSYWIEQIERKSVLVTESTSV